MKVTVKMVGSFVHVAGFSEETFDLAPDATIEVLLEKVKIGKSRPVVVARNGEAATPSEKLEDGDRVVISPVFSGG